MTEQIFPFPADKLLSAGKGKICQQGCGIRNPDSRPPHNSWFPRRSPQGEGGPGQALSQQGGAALKYVYILESLDSRHFYIGITDDLRARLAKHNAGEVPHTSKYGPWRIRTYVAFSDDKLAIAFEKYLKSGSGRAFAKKRL